MSDSNLFSVNLRTVFMKIYAITILGVGFSFLSGYLLQNIWISIIKMNIYAIVAIICAISFVRSLIKIDGPLPFCAAKVIDGFFFSIVFFVINIRKLASLNDLYLSCLITLLVFVVSALSSRLITRESYTPVLFTTKIIAKTYSFLCAIDLILFLLSPQHNFLFLNNLISFLCIVGSSLIVAVMTKSVVERPTVNIWYVGDTFSFLIMLIIRKIFFFLIDNPKKQ